MRMQRMHVIAVTALACFLAITIRGSAGNTECQEKVADVVFLLDSSYSIWQKEFGAQLAFLQDIIQTFTIGPNNMRVGVVTFSHEVRFDIRLNDHMARQDLWTAISKIKPMNGGTRTGDAIHFVHNTAFQPENGGRPWAAHILVLITDGYSYDSNQTQREAAVAREKGIEIFAIGVKKGAGGGDQEELHGIASQPKAAHVFTVDQYDKLGSIEQSVASTACRHEGNRTESVPDGEEPHNPRNKAVKRCAGKPLDVYFMLDSSSSIDRQQYVDQQHFLEQLLHIFDLAADSTRVGVAVYSDRVEEVVKLSQHQTPASIKAAVQDASYLSGGTDTSGALQHLTTHVFPSSRRQAARVAVILTDGQSQNLPQTAEAARRLRQTGVYVFSVGIGSQTDMLELMEIASDPDENFVFHVDNSGSLRDIRDLLAIKVCDVGPPDNVGDQAGHNCVTEPTDVIFVYDSAAVSSVESDIISGVIADFVQNIANDDIVRYGLVRENCYKGENIDLRTGANETEVEAFLHNPRHNGLHVLLQRVRRGGFLNVYDQSRARTHKFLVLLIGSKVQKIAEVVKEARRFQSQGVRLLMVTVGSDKEGEVLRPVTDLATAPAVRASDFSSLPSVTEGLIHQFCDVSQRRSEVH